MVTGLNTGPPGWEIEDCISNCHITLDLACFSLYSIADTNTKFWTAIYNLRQLYTTSCSCI